MTYLHGLGHSWTGVFSLLVLSKWIIFQFAAKIQQQAADRSTNEQLQLQGGTVFQKVPNELQMFF